MSDTKACATPIRAEFVSAIYTFMLHMALQQKAWSAGDLVDELIAKGLVPEEITDAS